ncbi:hypothetical protein RDI58_019889 [Solanum bulbocastanum]|uniref:Uncharacterized protein n=1 Tax=Solanum bulbocastanum TaxID=147425 RepID=A0AAN8TCI8_SOLBU
MGRGLVLFISSSSELLASRRSFFRKKHGKKQRGFLEVVVLGCFSRAQSSFHWRLWLFVGVFWLLFWRFLTGCFSRFQQGSRWFSGRGVVGSKLPLASPAL